MINEQPPEFMRTSSALDSTFTQYTVLDDRRINNHDIVSIFDYLKTQIISLIQAHPSTKVHFVVKLTMKQHSPEREEPQSLRTGAIAFLRASNPDTILTKIREIIYERLAKLEGAVGSGWTLVSIDAIVVKLAEFLTKVGSSYTPLPDELKYRRAIINMQNNGQECFKWAVTRALNPVKRDGESVTKILRKQVEKINWDDISFPTPFHHIDTFESVNKISVTVITWDEDDKQAEYLRLPQHKYPKFVRLFFWDGHFSVVSSISKLTNKDLHDRKYFFCNYCPYKHRSEDSVTKHMKECLIDNYTDVEMPKEGEFIRFKNYEYTVRKPHAIYADFECRLEKCEVKRGKKNSPNAKT